MRKTTFTTGEVAAICEVAPHTVAKWFDAGRLRGYRLPGGGDRRIPRESLVRFMRDQGMNLKGLDDDCRKVMLVGVDGPTADRLTGLLPADEFTVTVARSGFEAGEMAASNPDAAVIDTAFAPGEAAAIAAGLRAHGRRYFGREHVRVAALLHEDGDAAALLARGFDGVFERPLDLEAVAGWVIKVTTEERDR